jgi:F-type H+-transporting ATPase subunit c
MPDLTAIAAHVAQAAQAAAAMPEEAVAAAASLSPIGAGLAALAASIAVIGAGIGISKLAAAANESIARQPEVAGKITGNMILTAAFIEGVALFAVVVCLLAVVMK